MSKKKPDNAIATWLTMSIDEVFSAFASLPNAQRVGKGDRQFVYVPGTRKDKVLLVAHADTVFENRNDDVVIGYDGESYFSYKSGVGIGADDRAGCTILWTLRNLGHSLLVLNAEEKGCKGSHFLEEQKDWLDLVNSHQFAIEFDRRGHSDLIFYQVGSRAFTEWCEENFTGYKEAQGSWTDICVLCKTICGLNISVGYYNEHSASEILIEHQFKRTLDTAREVLSKPNLPRFEQPKRTIVRGFSGGGGGRIHPSHNMDEFDSFDQYAEEVRGMPRQRICDQKPDIITNIGDFTTIIVCPTCEGIMDESERKENKDACIYCNQKIPIEV